MIDTTRLSREIAVACSAVSFAENPLDASVYELTILAPANAATSRCSFFRYDAYFFTFADDAARLLPDVLRVAASDPVPPS